MEEIKKMKCKYKECQKEFIPKTYNQVYCCHECQLKNKTNLYDIYKERSKKNKKCEKPNTNKSDSWEKVNNFIKEYQEKTGRYISYGKAVVKMGIK